MLFSATSPRVVAGLAVFAGLFQFARADAFEKACHNLKQNLAIENATINLVQYVPDASTLMFPENDITCNRSSQVISADICRVALYAKTSPFSGVYLEAWLPRNWTGRFLSTGNGGLSGCIQYEDINYGTTLGFATVGTNNGHNGTSGQAFLNNPNVIEDYSYRSVHIGAAIGKAITNQFYKRNCTKSYYIGCSTGGRQGFQSAQMFPNDFDGIVAGSPTLAFTQLTAWAGWLGLGTGYNTTDPGFITPNLWKTIHKEILNQCDGIDGVIDGIIENPDLCYPNLDNLRCRYQSTYNCLNNEQARRANMVFEPFNYPNGSLIFPRMQPGSELESSSTFYSGVPSPYVEEWFGPAIYGLRNWDPRTLKLSDFTFAQELNPFGVNTWNGNLSAFNTSGGKLLHYHGLQDYLISSENSARYYNFVRETMSLKSSDLDHFYRYFRISGMGHCRQGPGAWMIGQSTLGNTGLDPGSNVLIAMVEWVEKGLAPTTIKGVKFRGDKAKDGLSFARKHCRYPYQNKYVGPQPPSNSEGWACTLQ
ncbi:Tannase/feruloyl esterase [Trichoderma velutinum]